ncbi:anaphase-promoting complex subunit 11 [Pisolithus croceorrhizus]|nr:anaphase-promoting complex subunit 11 [Pisolithus croceorrhizus]KAI6165463.1 anaphase-promoting complex subunit 11 [Pisolithus thermaeus]
MNVRIRHLCAVPPWRWNTSNKNDNAVADDDLGDVCGICRVPYEGCCPVCKMSGDDFLLSTIINTIWGRCGPVFHMHCLLKWLARHRHH